MFVKTFSIGPVTFSARAVSLGEGLDFVRLCPRLLLGNWVSFQRDRKFPQHARLNWSRGYRRPASGVENSYVFVQLFSPRFGNLVDSLVVLYILCRRLGGNPTVKLAKGGPFPIQDASWLDGRVFVTTKYLDAHLRKAPMVLSPTFFGLVAGDDMATGANEARPDIRKLFSLNSQKKTGHENHLTIHLRGGDIFTRNPHPAYVPFPLCFYREVLAKEPWTGVTIVSEDLKHPFLEKISLIVSENSLPLDFSSGGFRDDVETLLAASNLVASNGSFTAAVAYLSTRLSRVFTLLPEQFIRLPPEHGVIEVLAGNYAQYFEAQGPWTGSITQIQRMNEWELNQPHPIEESNE